MAGFIAGQPSAVPPHGRCGAIIAAQGDAESKSRRWKKLASRLRPRRRGSAGHWPKCKRQKIAILRASCAAGTVVLTAASYSTSVLVPPVPSGLILCMITQTPDVSQHEYSASCWRCGEKYPAPLVAALLHSAIAELGKAKGVKKRRQARRMPPRVHKVLTTAAPIRNRQKNVGERLPKLQSVCYQRGYIHLPCAKYR